jgi:hypothetical protein
MGQTISVNTITVTTAGTQIQVTSTPIYVESVYIEALGTNTGFIYVGDENVSSTAYAARLAAGEGFSLNVQKGKADDRINLDNIWIDSSVNGEKAQVTYLKGEDSN